VWKTANAGKRPPFPIFAGASNSIYTVFHFNKKPFHFKYLIYPAVLGIAAGIYLLAGSGIFAGDPVRKDSSLLHKDYSSLVFEQAESLPSAEGTKSVIFNATGNKLYAMNLEGMSVYEFDRSTRKVCREFTFKATKGMGYDYQLQDEVPSFQEKPVEACFSNHDSILWVSLHNAAGIVPIFLDSSDHHNTSGSKRVYVKDMRQHEEDSIQVPLIKTGKTPKVIARTQDSKYLLVSNWHSQTISALEVNDHAFPYGKVVATMTCNAIPRGIVVDDKIGKSYVAIMGGASISVINNRTWKIERNIKVANNPRHLLMDSSGHLFVSYNSLGQIACIDAASGKTLFTAATNDQPRTIALSKNQHFLFVTCYEGNKIDVFKIGKDRFTRLYALDCPGKPVGIDVFEDDSKLEAWVCNYVGGNLKVFSFKKK